MSLTASLFGEPLKAAVSFEKQKTELDIFAVASNQEESRREKRRRLKVKPLAIRVLRLGA